MNLNYSQKYLEDVLVRFTFHSTGIEGNSMTLGRSKVSVIRWGDKNSRTKKFTRNL